ncbi:virulence RhuM family protein [Hoylesella enoeca]|uniref:DNA-binding protein n=1 Tax=Hoylesella enoeca TaxID=76123 RepID=A0A0S2KML8_9BACT|nr:RhuM family protein [Hoylesella enoeca]ALO49542.1 DNA-binding protein [Hoylesella enoeca]
MEEYTNDNNEIILYQSEDTVKINVRIADDTVWLTQAQLVELFQSSKANISEHIKSIYQQQELDSSATVRKFRTVRYEGKRQISRDLVHYNLDTIISIGYRVNTKRGIHFRQWATQVLKDHLLKGYSVNHRLSQLENRMDRNEEQIAFFVRTALPPVEGVFYDGQVFDAYVFASNLVRSAQHSIVLIDNYIDESVLTILAKRRENIAITLFTAANSPLFHLDLNRYQTQYGPTKLCRCKTVHDRFLIIDNVVYHLGASLKDLGKKLFAFSKMEIPAQTILSHISITD